MLLHYALRITHCFFIMDFPNPQLLATSYRLLILSIKKSGASPLFLCLISAHNRLWVRVFFGSVYLG